MTMTTRTRVAITVASALALGITSYGSTWTAGDPGLARELWNWSGLAAYAFAILGVSLVNRWWALLPALAPAAAGIYIYNFTDYVYPWSEGITADGAAGIVLYLLAAGFQAAVLAIGLVLRWFWDRGRRVYLSRRGPTPSHRG